MLTRDVPGGGSACRMRYAHVGTQRPRFWPWACCAAGLLVASKRRSVGSRACGCQGGGRWPTLRGAVLFVRKAIRCVPCAPAHLAEQP